jgi:hypothetical protein
MKAIPVAFTYGMGYILSFKPTTLSKSPDDIDLLSIPGDRGSCPPYVNETLRCVELQYPASKVSRHSMHRLRPYGTDDAAGWETCHHQQSDVDIDDYNQESNMETDSTIGR